MPIADLNSHNRSGQTFSIAGQIYISEARWLFLSLFWPLLNWVSFLEAAWAVV